MLARRPPRSHFLRVRLTQATAAALERIATAAGLTVSELIRAEVARLVADRDPAPAPEAPAPAPRP